MRVGYFFGGTMASLKDLAGLIFTTVFAGILMGSPVAGFRPVRAFLLTRTDLPMPGSTKAPFFLVSAIASTAYSSMIDAAALLEIANFPAN
jgi:hypothetical protein